MLLVSARNIDPNLDDLESALTEGELSSHRIKRNALFAEQNAFRWAGVTDPANLQTGGLSAGLVAHAVGYALAVEVRDPLVLSFPKRMNILLTSQQLRLLLILVHHPSISTLQSSLIPIQ